RSVGAHAPRLRGEPVDSRRVLLRPRAHRTAAVRWIREPKGWGAVPGSVAARARRGAQAGGRREVRGPRRAVNREPRALAEVLERELRGEVRFDRGSRALYATDASNYRQVPIGVVVPRDLADVEAAVAACRRHGAPLLSRGGGTSLAGQCCNVAVVLDMSRHVNGLLALDPQA